MLRITKNGTASEEKWILYKRLSGPMVVELETSWEKTRLESHGRKCVVDLTDVTFIDERGESVLRAMRNQGAEFVARGVDTKQVLAELRSKRKRPLRRCLAHLGHKVGF